MWDAIAANLPTDLFFSEFYLVVGGDLDLKLKKPPKGGPNIPFVI
jgi:hypothetical protein